jgi:hypothetical protein
MISRQLFYPELVNKVKELAAFFKIYLVANRRDKLEYLTVLQEILDFEPPLKFSRIEEVREKTKTKCNICKVDLVYPAYLVYISEKGVEEKSQPIGIMCLHSLHGKLDDFSKSLELAWNIQESDIVMSAKLIA